MHIEVWRDQMDSVYLSKKTFKKLMSFFFSLPFTNLQVLRDKK